MLKIKDYYTDAPSAGIITMLEKPEVVNRLLNTLICNFAGFDFMKLTIDLNPVREELEEYKNLNQAYLNQICKLKAYYDGHQLALKRILKDINYDTHLNTKVYSPVVGCPVGCSYCFTKKVVDHFGITEDFKKAQFRGFYKLTKDADGYDIPELFNIESENPVDWFLTYMSDYGCWRPEWQENVLGQIIAANELKHRQGKCVDTFQLVTKNPRGIHLENIPSELDLFNVVFSCTVDKNSVTKRITDLIEKTGTHHVTGCVVYQPVLEYIEPVHLDELVEKFGKEYCWVIIGGEIGGKEPCRFEWIKDIIDKCIELGIPVKIEPDLKKLVENNGYEFLVQEPKPIRDAKFIRKRNLAVKNASVSECYELKAAELNRRLKDVGVTIKSAKKLLDSSPDFDVILTVETKGVPLAYEMARQSGKSYITARKTIKRCMTDAIEVSVESVTTGEKQKLCLDKEDAEAIKGRKVLIVDNIIGTGESLKALEALVEKAGGILSAKAVVLAESDVAKRDNIIFLEPLPAFSHETA